MRAPGARLRLAHDTPEAVDQATQTLWSTDLIVLPHGFISDLPHVDLHRDRWVLVVSADDDEVGESLTVDQLTTMPWVATYRGPTASTSTARQMRMLGVEPRVSVVTESSLTVPGLVAGSDRIGLLQVRLVRLLPVDVGICALPPPFELGRLVEAMWWHPVYDHNPEHEFFLDLVLRAAHQPTERTT